MMNTTCYRLVVCEKPSVARSIAAVLGAGKREDGFLSGGGYLVSWCFGHLAELSDADAYDEKYGKWRREDLPILPDSWQYTVARDKQKQMNTLRTLMHRDDVYEVVNACDAGREGELIFRTAYNLNNCRKRVKRLWISSMEDAALLDGFDNLRDGAEYDNLYASALCRSKADWLVGINATRLFSVMYHRTLNVGRVVSPTLALLVQREAEINAFQPETFYTVHLDFNGFSAAGERMKEQAEAERLAGDCDNKSAAVTSIMQTKKTEKAPALYDLTTLQRDANRLLGYTAQQTLDYLQSLYEKKLCTYPRTDSRYLTDDMEGGVNALALCCAGICGTEPPAAVCSGQVCSSKKVSDHHAVVPTMAVGETDLETLLAGERELLRLVSRQVLMAVSAPFVYDQAMKVVKLKQMAKTLIYLEENGFADFDALADAAADAEKRFYALKATIKAAEARMGEIQTLRTHIMNYSRTRSVYTGYRKAGYSKKYLAEHEGDILIHKAAKKAFDAFGLKKLPTVRSLNEEFARLMAEKKAAYAEYHRAQEQMRELLIHKANAAYLLGLDEQNRQTTERQREEK